MPTDAPLNLDAFVRTPFRAISPPLALAPGPFFGPIWGSYDGINLLLMANTLVATWLHEIPVHVGFRRDDGTDIATDLFSWREDGTPGQFRRWYEDDPEWEVGRYTGDQWMARPVDGGLQVWELYGLTQDAYVQHLLRAMTDANRQADCDGQGRIWCEPAHEVISLIKHNKFFESLVALVELLRAEHPSIATLGDRFRAAIENSDIHVALEAIGPLRLAIKYTVRNRKVTPTTLPAPSQAILDDIIEELSRDTKGTKGALKKPAETILDAMQNAPHAVGLSGNPGGVKTRLCELDKQRPGTRESFILSGNNMTFVRALFDDHFAN